MKPNHLLIFVAVACLLLVSARDSLAVVQEQATDPAPLYVQAQPDAPLIPKYIRFHPRFYKEDGETGRSSTLYLQNPNQMQGNYNLKFYDCTSGNRIAFSPDWQVSPRVTRVAGPGDFPDLPPGCYSLVITSDTDLAHASLVEETRSGGPATDKLATYPGFAEEESGSRLRFGPFLKGEVNSTVHIWNVSLSGSATVTASAYGASGKRYDLPPCPVAEYAQCTFDASALPQEATPPFVGVLDVQMNGGSALGIMALGSTAGDFYEYRKPLATGAAEVCLPRVLKQVNEGGVLRSTALFVANAASLTSDVNLVFYQGNGTPSAAKPSFSLAANGSRYLKLADVEQLDNGIWSVCASGTQPLTMEEVTQADTPSAAPVSSATRGGSELGMLNIPDRTHLALTHLMRSDASYTAFSLQNPGGTKASVDVKYYDLSGASIYTASVELPPKGWARFNQSTQPELGNAYVGSPVVSSDQPLVALVDAYMVPPVKSVFLPLVLR